MSNMKQLGLAFTQYLQDYDGCYPGAAQKQKWADGGHWVTGGDTLPTDYANGVLCLADEANVYAYQSPKHAMVDKGALYPYVKNTQVYICPSTPDGDKKLLSYSMNCAVGFKYVANVPQPIMDAAITDSAGMVLLVDEANTLNDGFFWAANNNTSTDSLTQSHNGGGNLLFTDGHVKFYPFAAFPLDNSTIGLNNKVSTTGVPHFQAGTNACP